MKFTHSLLSCRTAVVAAAVLAVSAGVAAADRFSSYTLMGWYAAPSAGAFQDAFDKLVDGRVILLAANDVFVESWAGARTFRLLGPLTGEGAPVAYPAFVRVSPDGSRLAVGNNAGAVGVFELDGMKGVWYRVAHFDADWLDDRHLVIRAGEETVTLLDTKSQPEDPVNPVLIQNCPVAAGIVFDADGNLFTGNGFGKGEPSDTGWIMYFAESRWRGVLRGDPAIDFEEEGILVADLLSANSLGFDAEGHLHVGGGDLMAGDAGYAALINAEAVADAVKGKGPADPEDPKQVRKFDPDLNEPDNWYDVTAVPAMNELLIRDAATSTIHVHGLPGGVECEDVRKLKAKCRPGRRIRIRVRLTSADHDGNTMYVTVDGIPFRGAIRGKKLKSRFRNPEAGEHTVKLVDPGECQEPVIVICE